MASPTLADLRAKKATLNGTARAKTATVSLVTADALVTEIEDLQRERLDILMSTAREGEDGERSGPPRKAGERALPPRVEEIDARTIAANDELADHQGEVGYIPAMDLGEWIRWKDAHPPREDNVIDMSRGGGHCNASDLIAELGRFVTHWNGEELAAGEWDEWLRDAILPRDVQVLATRVIALYETGIERVVPKSLNGSSPTETSATD